MSNVGFATLTIIPSARGIQGALRKELGGLGGMGQQAGREIGDGVHGGFGRAISGLGALAGKAALGIAAGGAIAAGFGLKIAASNEQAMISFTTMLGSAEKAGGFLKQLQAFAAKTPFEFPELQTAASSLISAGFEASKVIPIMTTLGNVTSGMGTGSEGVKRATVALQQMSAAGKITGEDLNQLRDAGIPVFDLLAGATGKSKEEIAKLAAAGKLGKKEMQQLFTALETGGGGLERFNGLMEAQSKSLTGMVSTLKDTLGQGLASIMAPAVEGIKNAMPGLTSALDSMLKSAGPGLTAIISTIIDLVSSVLPAVGPILAALGDTFRETFAALAPAIKVLLPAFARIIIALLPALPAMARAISALAPIVVVLANALAAVIEAIPPNVLAAMIVGFVALTQVVLPLVAVFSAASSVGAALAVLFPTLAAVIGLLTAPVLIVIAAVAALAAIAYVVIRNWSTIADFFTDLWGKVTGAFRAAVGFLGSIAGTVGRVMLASMTFGMSEVVVFMARNWDKIKSGLTDAIGALGRLAGSIPGRIKSAVGDLGSLLFEVGKDIIRGLIRGLDAMTGGLLSKAASIAGKVLGVLKKVPLISSPSRVTTYYGKMLGAGLIEGMGQMEAPLLRAATGLAAAALPTSIATPLSGGVAMAPLTRAQLGDGATPTTVYATFELDGRTLGRATAVALKEHVDNGGSRPF